MLEYLDLIILLILLLFILIKGTTITIKVEMPTVEAAVPLEDNLYDKEGDLKEESDEDYLRDLLKEVHSIFQEEDVKE